MSRPAHGAALASYARVAADEFVLIAGAGEIRSYQSSPAATGTSRAGADIAGPSVSAFVAASLMTAFMVWFPRGWLATQTLALLERRCALTGFGLRQVAG